MRLHRHDEIAEAVREAINTAIYGKVESTELQDDIAAEAATAALDAMLEAVVKLDVGGLVPVVLSINPERYGKQLVIELEPKP